MRGTLGNFSFVYLISLLRIFFLFLTNRNFSKELKDLGVQMLRSSHLVLVKVVYSLLVHSMDLCGWK